MLDKVGIIGIVGKQETESAKKVVNDWAQRLPQNHKNSFLGGKYKAHKKPTAQHT